MMRQSSVAGTAPTALGKQRGGVLLPFGSDIEALWYLGTDYHDGAASEGAPLTDLSGNDHTLTRTGDTAAAGMKAKHFIGNGVNYLTTSFTGDYLANTVGRAGELAIMAWCVAIPTKTRTIATNELGAAGFGNRYVSLRATDNFDAVATFHDGTSAQTPALGNPADPDRATKVRSFMGAWRAASVLTGYEAGGDRERAFGEYRNVNAAGVIGGGQFIVAFTGDEDLDLKVSAIAFLNRFPSPSRARRIDHAVRFQLASYGLSFS